MRTYNLFCRADRNELICAVPEDRPVPSFITGPPWDFVARVQESVIETMGYDHDAAEVSVQWNGFYLFQLTKALGLQLKDCQDIAAEAIDDAPLGARSHRKVPAHSSEFRAALAKARLEVEAGLPSNSQASPLPSPVNDTDLYVTRE